MSEFTETMHDAAVRLSAGRCGNGCDGCPAVLWRDSNGACLIRRIAKNQNAGEQVLKLQDWAYCNPKLLPCPFCGGSNLEITNEKDFNTLDRDNNGAAIRISCNDCNFDLWEHAHGEHDYFKRRMMLVRKWHRRANNV